MKRKIQWPLISAIAVTLMIMILLLTSGGILPRVFQAGALKTPKSPVPVGSREYSLEELQEDFTRIRSVVEKKHTMLFADRREVGAAFDRQYALLEDGMGELEFYRVLSPAIAALECGHSNVLLSQEYESYVKKEAGLFPAHVAVAGTRLYASESKVPSLLPSGAEIVSINGFSSEEILTVLFESISSDGGIDTRKAEVIGHQFPYLFYSLIDDADRFTVDFRAPDKGAGRETVLNGAGFSELWSGGSRIYSIDILLDGEELKRDYSGGFFDEYAVLTVGSFILDNGAFAEYLEDFFRELERKEIDRLILDLRGNWGGTPKPAALLLSYLSEEPLRYLSGDAPFYMFAYKRARAPKEHAFNGSTYLLTDGACFSTTAHLISLLEHHDLATLIGEETGGSAACSDGKRLLTLPNTGLRIYYSTTVFTTDVNDFPIGEGIEPDYKLIYRPEEVAGGIDPAMELAVSLR